MEKKYRDKVTEALMQLEQNGGKVGNFYTKLFTCDNGNFSVLAKISRKKKNAK